MAAAGGAVLALLAGVMLTPPGSRPEVGPAESTRPGIEERARVVGTATGAGPRRLTPGEELAVEVALQACLPSPAGGPVDRGPVDLELGVGPDGVTVLARLADSPRIGARDGLSDAARLVVQAAMDPRCQPLPLPRDGTPGRFQFRLRIRAESVP